MNTLSCRFFQGQGMLAGLILLVLLGQVSTVQAANTCALVAGQVVINEILPRPSDTNEWVELYNKTDAVLDLSYCYLDDIPAGGGPPFQIAPGESIPAHGFWTISKNSYFNNDGDDVRLLSDDASTVLDSYTYGATSVGYSWYRNPDGEAWSVAPTASPTIGASNVDACGDGKWQAGTLEIHHIDVGQGDSTLIVGPTGKSLLFDVGATSAGNYVAAVLGCKKLDYVVVSHFHEDHIGSVGSGGLWDLVENQGFTVTQTILRDYNNYVGDKDLSSWKAYLEGSGAAKLHPVNAVEGTAQIDLGTDVVINILTVNGNGVIKEGNFNSATDPPSENDYSLGFLLSYHNFDEWLAGDLDGELDGHYHDIELSTAKEVGDVDVYRVHHHGSSHSSNNVFIGQLDPEVSIISVGDGNTFSHPTTAVMQALAATSTVYRTERGEPVMDVPEVIVGGNIVIRMTDGISYTVNYTLNSVPISDSYTATEPNRIDADKDGYFVEVDPDDNDAPRIPSPNGGCDPDYQICICQAVAGQVVINEVLPAPVTGQPEWVELYNTTSKTIDMGLCNIDDALDGKKPYQIPGGTLIQPHGFWSENDFSAYFNNDGDSVRFLAGDQTTVLDIYTFGATASNASWYRYPDGGSWAASTTSSPTRGSSNVRRLTLSSQNSYDGWILESAENSNTGGAMSATTTTLRIGDDAARKQYRSILSFKTGDLPDTAVITKITLKMKRQGVTGGGDPISLFHGFMTDFKKGIFGTAPLQVSDWQATANKTLGPFTPTFSSGWYTFNLSTAKAYINKLASGGGLTQIRLRFKLDDNNNAIANYLSLYSGEAAAASRPQLIIEYYVP